MAICSYLGMGTKKLFGIFVYVCTLAFLGYQFGLLHGRSSGVGVFESFILELVRFLKLLPVSCLENMAAMVLVVQLEKKLEVSEFRFNYSLSTLALSIIPSFSILPDAYIFRDLGFIHSSE